LRDLLLVADPKLLQDYDAAIRQQEHDRRAHARLVAKRKRERQLLIQQVLVGGTTLIIGGGLAILVFMLIIKAFG
jgi:predicted metal-dependent hydrolase